MTAFPSKTDLDGSTAAPSTGTFKAAIGALWAAITGLVGTDGTVATARSTLGVAPAHGQCRLSKSGSNLVLSPFNGNKLMVGGEQRAIPAAGVTLAPAGLTPGTLYYIYATWSGSALVLEASATTHATDTSTGVEVMSGNTAKTLVGMARPVAGPAFVNGGSQALVRSWFNDPGTVISAGFTATRSTASTSQIEVNTEIRNEFLAWANEIVTLAINGRVQGSAINGLVSTTVSFDGAAAEDVYCSSQTWSNGAWDELSLSYAKSGLSEGYHYATLFGEAFGQTGSWLGAASGNSRTTLRTLLAR